MKNIQKPKRALPKPRVMHTLIRFLAVAAITMLTACQDETSRGIYQVGIQVSSIAPVGTELERACLGGYGLPLANPRCGSVVVHDPPSARAMYISDGDENLVLLVLDAPGLGDSLIRDIREAVVARESALTDNRVLIAATHTHAGPDLQGVWGGTGDTYRERLIRTAADTVVRAVETAEPATLRASRSLAAVSNRRGLSEVDDQVISLHFVATDSGDRIGTVINMSAHPTVLDEANLLYSADYVYSLRKSVEREFGGVALFVNGIVGDAEFATEERTFAAADQFGEDTAVAIIDGFDKAKAITGPIQVSHTNFSFAVTSEALLPLTKHEAIDVNIDSQDQLHARLTWFSIGQALAGISFPGEALTGLGLPLKEQLNVEYPMFLGLTDASWGYFMPANEFGAIPGRQTEERFCLNPAAGDAISATITEFIKQQQ